MKEEYRELTEKERLQLKEFIQKCEELGNAKRFKWDIERAKKQLRENKTEVSYNLKL